MVKSTITLGILKLHDLIYSTNPRPKTNFLKHTCSARYSGEMHDWFEWWRIALSADLCLLWRDLLNCIRMSTINLVKDTLKKAKNHYCGVPSWKFIQIRVAPIPPTFPVVQFEDPKSFPTKAKSTKSPGRDKKNKTRKGNKEGRRGMENGKSRLRCARNADCRLDLQTAR